MKYAMIDSNISSNIKVKHAVPGLEDPYRKAISPLLLPLSAVQKFLSSDLPQRRSFLHPQISLRTALQHVTAIGQQPAQFHALIIDVEERIYGEDLLTVRLGIIEQ